MTVDRDSELWLHLREQMAGAWHDDPSPHPTNGWDRVIAALIEQPEIVQAVLAQATVTREQEEANAIEGLLSILDDTADPVTPTQRKRRRVQHRGTDD